MADFEKKEFSEIRRLIAQGTPFKRAEIREKSVDPPKYLILFISEGGAEFRLMPQKRKDRGDWIERKFSTIDAAYKLIKQVGYMGYVVLEIRK